MDYRNQQGIGLLEVIVSISILGVGVFGLLQAFPQTATAQNNIVYDTVAYHLIQQKLEELAALPYEAISVGYLESEARVTSDTASTLRRFRRTTVVSYVDANLQPSGADIGLKKVVVTIAWPAANQELPRSVSVTTLLSNH